MKVIIEINTEDNESILGGANIIRYLQSTYVEIPTPPAVKKAMKKPESKPTPRSSKKVEDVSEEEKTEKVANTPSKSSKNNTEISLAELKDLAKAKAQSAGREKVKECIGKFGAKLTEVAEADFDKLHEALGKL